MGKPAERRSPFLRSVGGGQQIAHATKSSLADPVDRSRRDPGAFVVAGGELAIGTDADAVRRAKAAGDDIQLFAIFAQLEEATGMGADLAVAAAAAKPAAARA